MEKFDKQDQRLLAIWAADCAKRALPFFRKARPHDHRPRKAIETLQRWVRTGVFSMTVIRTASLDAHAAARRARPDSAARYAARAAGQAVATAHVPEHAFGASYYALKAAMAAHPDHAQAALAKELEQQSRRFPRHLRQAWQEWQSRRLPKTLLQQR
jgi:hypothetical protein